MRSRLEPRSDFKVHAFHQYSSNLAHNQERHSRKFHGFKPS